ncbi:UNVERIFIED_CONTAM: hypothetical protein RKD50_009528 [Streptomyces canus]
MAVQNQADGWCPHPQPPRRRRIRETGRLTTLPHITRRPTHQVPASFPSGPSPARRAGRRRQCRDVLQLHPVASWPTESSNSAKSPERRHPPTRCPSGLVRQAEPAAAAKLDIDHIVPLAEAWHSGASAWSAARREAYANDQDAASLVAVTARTNRQKADQDPSTWLPLAPAAIFRYLADRAATKLRWGLTAEKSEIDTINVYAGGPCRVTVVHYIPAL